MQQRTGRPVSRVGGRRRRVLPTIEYTQLIDSVVVVVGRTDGRPGRWTNEETNVRRSAEAVGPVAVSSK